MRIRKSDQKYTGFKFEGTTFVFARVPFGLKNSSAALVRCLGEIIQNKYQDNVTIYVDDVIIATKTFERHVEILKSLFQLFIDNNVVLNIEKSNFCVEKVKFLGYEINSQGVKMCKENIEQIEKMPRPKNIKQLRGFLGALGYYNRFFKNYANSVGPLYELLKKNKKWEWTAEHEAVFRNVKEKFKKAIMLSHPDFDQRFHIQTDSSGFGLGAILYQKDEESGEEKIIALASRILQGPEKAYSTTLKEALAIIFALEKFRVCTRQAFYNNHGPPSVNIFEKMSFKQ